MRRCCMRRWIGRIEHRGLAVEREKIFQVVGSKNKAL
jgi:hypothetical protein